jgi:8-oxo-dGTP diphosphatase
MNIYDSINQINIPLMIDVTCAIIRNEDNEVLIVQRGEKTDHPFKWEFPGGKKISGENDEECIIREICEELSMDIVICACLNPVEYNYGHKQIRLIPFICDTLDELPLLSEHVAFKWISAEDLANVDFSEADVYVAEQYQTGLEKSSALKEVQILQEQQSSPDDADLRGMINNMMSMQEADWVAASAIENPVVFNKLLEYSYSKDRKLAFRASWTLSKACDKFPELIYPHLPAVVESLPLFDNESVQRSFLRIISLSETAKLNSHLHGILADHCFAMLKSGFSAIAIKAYSMEILYNLSVIYPELGNELSSSIRILMEDGSAGIISRGKSILKKISGISLDPGSSQKLS